MWGQETQVPLGENISNSLNRAASHGSQSNLALDSHGDENTTEYRIKAVDKTGASKPISLWHDVTLVHVDPATDRPTPYLNFVCEIPKFSRFVVYVVWILSIGLIKNKLLTCFPMHRVFQEEVRDRHRRGW
jgi:hypothetical protein